MTAPAADKAAPPGIPTPSKQDQAQATLDSWRPADVAAATLHLTAYGAAEDDARLILSALAWRGIRRVRAYVDKMTEADVAAWLASLARWCRVPSLATAAGGRGFIEWLDLTGDTAADNVDAERGGRRG